MKRFFQKFPDFNRRLGKNLHRKPAMVAGGVKLLLRKWFFNHPSMICQSGCRCGRLFMCAGRLNLRAHRMGRAFPKTAPAQVLFDSFEEQFHLPAPQTFLDWTLVRRTRPSGSLVVCEFREGT
ncbi:MAG: hypothetical protein ABSG80_11440 [Verrucomicrobiota bacterium]|jgi:hypothetical protein